MGQQNLYWVRVLSCQRDEGDQSESLFQRMMRIGRDIMIS